jgi:hypothetical protein
MTKSKLIPIEQIAAGIEDAERRWRQGKRVFRHVIEHNMALNAHATQGERTVFPSIREMLAGLPGAWRNEMPTPVAATINWLCFRLRELADRPTYFDLSEGVALRLLATELRGITTDDVQLPYQAFCIALPDGVLEVRNDQTGWHRCSGLIVGEGHWQPEPGVVAGRRLVLATYGEPNGRSAHVQDDTCMTFSLPLIPGADMNSAVEQMAYPGGVTLRTHDGRELAWADAVRYLARFATNLCLYLSSPNADVVWQSEEPIRKLAGKRDKVSRERAKRLRADRIYVVGGKVHLSTEERDALRAADTRSVAYKSLVRGHWRQQAHGPGRQLRRPTWIAPHVRQKGLDQTLEAHDYAVRR